MDIIARIDEIIKLRRELLAKERELTKESGIGLCNTDTSIHVFQGIEKVEEALQAEAKFSIQESSSGDIAYKTVYRDGTRIFQLGSVSKPTEYSFLPAEVINEDNK